MVDLKGATYKFDNSVVASSNELTYYPYQSVNNDTRNQLADVFFFDALGRRRKTDITDRTFDAGWHHKGTLPY